MSDDLSRERAKALNQARALARSGLHANHQSVVDALRDSDAFEKARRWFEDARFKTQLNQICVHAREMQELRAQPIRARVRGRTGLSADVSCPAHQSEATA